MSTLKSQRGWLKCSKCKLSKTRTNVVLGEGNTNADIMFVGESPGPTEDTEGRPFVGASGGMLEKFLAAFDINRADVFTDNICGCWAHIRENGNNQTRKPTPEEMLACKPRILESIYTIDPKVVVTLGSPALQSLTGETAGITAAAGEVYEVVVPGWYTNVAYPVYAMFHPAFLLRQTPPANNDKMSARHPIVRAYKHFEDLLETLGILNEAYYGVKIST